MGWQPVPRSMSNLREVELLLPPGVIRAVQDEAYRAHIKHGDHSLLGDGLTPCERLAVLVEEVGEVAKTLTYDQDPQGLADELVQVASVALSWYTWLIRQRVVT